MLKMCVFYGCQILVENNKVGLIQHFRRRGYSDYLMARPESTHTKFSKTRQSEVGLPTTGQAVISALIDATQAYIYDYVGILEDGTMGNVFFYELLKDWLEFEATNRTKYDASMAAGITLLAAQKNIKVKKNQKNTYLLLGSIATMASCQKNRLKDGKIYTRRIPRPICNTRGKVAKILWN